MWLLNFQCYISVCQSSVVSEEQFIAKLPMKPILGAHMSIAKGFAHAAAQSRAELDCNAMQIFIKSPRGGRAKELSTEDVAAYKQALIDHEIEFVVAHSSYLLNFAKKIDSKDNWQLANIADDFEKLGRLGGAGLVYHVGKFLDLDRPQAFAYLVENLKEVLKLARAANVPLLLENCAGQGTEMGSDLLEIKALLETLNDDYLKVCIDSCHAFAAGYDLREVSQVDTFFETLKQTIGLDQVVCFHFNDSKAPLASRKDRHENIGQGQIGESGLKHFARLATKHGKPILVETPLVNDSHLPDVNLIKSWF